MVSKAKKALSKQRIMVVDDEGAKVIAALAAVAGTSFNYDSNHKLVAVNYDSYNLTSRSCFVQINLTGGFEIELHKDHIRGLCTATLHDKTVA